MNRPTRLLLAAGALLALLLAGCGVRPSDVISGGPAPAGTVEGVRFYLLSDGEPTVVLRGLKPMRLDEMLSVLAAGPTPTEQQAGFTSEVPADIAPAKIGVAGDGVLVSLATEVRGLSVLAVVQIVCTVQAVAGDAPVTLVNGEQSRGPLKCPAYL
ncbi:hypothetical protein Ais01nite_23730 [Asanoa ishikariensis]|uniref:Sporulation and spore germination n=1 Tax=Asanoa ishikariensis TaxID=137265 RepID=A0A1H3R8A3_9ACTN|nr:hypothetical protein [Asanoa ishikariensis]GIF64338.1 hypothetical protein Ais01nite_23730 [Asanoa ishikariensis]SDZ21545.1 hypothetical protein SAMN05421684_3544 [Asanoa ishikariensis]